MKLLAMLICRNEADRYLEWTIPSLLEFVDEIRVVDDASNDGTAEILREHGCVVWTNERPLFYEHEGRARNLLLDFALAGEPTHLLSIDADEMIADGQVLRQAAERRATRIGIWNVWMEEIWKADEQSLWERVDGQWSNRKVPILYEVPRRMPSNWRINDRALASGREPRPVALNGIRSKEQVLTSLFHLGWSCKADRQSRYNRYVEHDGGAFHASNHLTSIMFDDDRVRLKPRPWPASLEPIKAGLLERINRE